MLYDMTTHEVYFTSSYGNRSMQATLLTDGATGEVKSIGFHPTSQGADDYRKALLGYLDSGSGAWVDKQNSFLHDNPEKAESVLTAWSDKAWKGSRDYIMFYRHLEG